MLILKSNYDAVWGRATWAKFVKGFNAFPMQYDKAPDTIDLINFAGVEDLSTHFIKTQILPIRRKAAYENNILIVMLRGSKAVAKIESESGKILVALHAHPNIETHGNALPDLNFIVCTSVSITFKNGGYGTLFAYDNTMFVFHDFSIIDDTSYELTSDLQKVMCGNEKNFSAKGKDLLVDCFDVNEKFFIHRIEPYVETESDNEAGDTVNMPTITSVTITDENSIRLQDDSPGSKMNWGVRLVHEKVTTSYSWEKAFPNLLKAHAYLKSMDLARYFGAGKWLNVPLKSGKIDELNEYETIDNR